MVHRTTTSAEQTAASSSTAEDRSRESRTMAVDSSLASGDNRTMDAVLLQSYGPPENLQRGRIGVPSLKPDQVLIRVHAAGLNPIDYRIRSGSMRLLLPARFPLVLGFDVAGEIVGMGHEAADSPWNLGDPVIAFLEDRHGGGYAEYAAASLDAIASKPPQLSFAEAASLPLAASTALQALRDQIDLEPRQRVLINGAAGGVGSFAVQIAKSMGAEVTAVCSHKHHHYVHDLGADHALDYHDHDYTELNESFDAIFDVAAKSTFVQAKSVLTRDGCYVTTVPSATNLIHQLTSQFSARRCVNFLVTPDGGDLQIISNLVEEGSLRTNVQETFSLDEAARAHGLLETGHTEGKLVFELDG